ncbi:MAG: hypothetical protein M3315_07070 [Actinomycetota bacterium]|nr:hypothetical protein [Actinomycetota bacterium]
MRARMDDAVEQGVARLFLLEAEHELVLREAELRWVRELVPEIEDGTLGGIPQWRSFHSEHEWMAQSKEKGATDDLT